ncbi:MAG: TolC family protein [Limisphaerales bacterium]
MTRFQIQLAGLVVVAAGVVTTRAAGGVSSPGEFAQLSRREAIEQALAHNPAIVAGREQVEQARAQIHIATAFPDPQFYSDLEEEKSFLRPRTATAQDIGIGLDIPFPDKFRLRRKIARGGLRAAEFALTQLKQQISFQTWQAYDALLVAVQHRRDLRESKTLAEDFLKKTEARYRAGTAPKLDTIKARVDLAQAENGLIANERAIATSRATLNRLLGRGQGALVEAADPLDLPEAVAELEGLEKLAILSRPELQRLSAQQTAAHVAITLAREYWLPDLNLTLARNFTQGDPPAYATIVGFSLPLLFWQHEKGEVAQARHREKELVATYADLLAQIDLDVRTTYAAATTALRQARYLGNDLLPEAREAFRIVSTSYGLGRASALDVLDAKRTLLDAQKQFTDALGAANDARADLERAAGAHLPHPAPEASHETK